MDTKTFFDIETEYDLNSQEYDGFAYWTYSRFFLMRYINAQKNGLSEYHNKAKDIKSQLQTLVSLLWNSLTHSYYKRRQYDLMVLNHERRQLVDKVYECIYTDELIEEYDCCVFERTYQRRHLKPTATKNLVYTDFTEIKSELLYLVNKFIKTRRYRKVKFELQQRISKIIPLLEKSEQISIDSNKVVEQMVKTYFGYKVRKKYFLKVISNVKPKAIIEVVSYNIDCMVVNEIAKENGIPTIELQHGTIGEEHLGYNYPVGVFIRQFPTKILTFSRYWSEKVTFPLEKENVIAVGYPYFERQLQKYRHVEHEKETILFLSQGGGLGTKFSKIAIELLERMPNIRIIYKLHPGEFAIWKREYPWLINQPGIEVVDSLDKNVYQCLAECDIAVGIASTTLFEATPYKIPIFIMDNIFIEMCSYLLQTGLAEKFNDTRELIEKINQKKKANVITDEVYNYLWEKNALTKIKKIISENVGGKNVR